MLPAAAAPCEWLCLQSGVGALPRKGALLKAAAAALGGVGFEQQHATLTGTVLSGWKQAVSRRPRGGQ